MATQNNEKIIWVMGNRQQLIIPMEQEVIPQEGEPYTEDFYPAEDDVVKVTLTGAYRPYIYTPEVDGHLLILTDNGTLPKGLYGVQITVVGANGETRLRSFWDQQIIVTEKNNSVLKEWDEFKEQDVKARAAVFFFAKGDKGDPGTTDYNDLINKPTIPSSLADLTDDASHRTVSDTEKTTWNNKANVVDGKVQAINGFEVTGDSASVSGLFLPFTDHFLGITEWLSVIGRNSDKEVLIGHVKAPDLVFAFNNTAVRMTTLAQQGALAEAAYQKPLNGIPASDIAQGVIPDVSNFITRSVNDLVNYYKKSETYTQSEVNALIGSIQQFHYEIYPSLQDITTPATNVLYLIGPTGSGSDKYEEYVYANNAFAKIGDTSIDLSDYVTTQALNSTLQLFARDLQTELNNYALKSQIKSVNGISLIGSGDIDTHEVFLGKYLQTSYEEISFALFNFKSIWMEEGSKPENKFALSCNLGSNNGGFVFYRIKPERIEWFTLDEETGYSSIYSLDLQSKLTFDNTPTANSNNPVKSGGIKTALDAKQDSIEDLATIRSGAAAGATAYQKPSGGIPASDIAAGVIPDVSQFITRSVDDLVNYYKKSETYTQSEVNALIGSIQQFHYEIYPSLQDITSPATNVLYLIGPSGSGNDKYEEYVYANSALQKIGDTSIDLSGYVTTQALNTALANYVTSSALTTALAAKQDSIEDLATIRSGAAAGATAVQTETLNSALSNTVAESGVYDVTANNDNAKFSSLSALLSSENLGTLIPLTKRKGGMSIKYVQSSDNKYVQYRLTAEAFSTNVEDWEEAGDVTKEDLENGTVIPALANNLASWAGSTQNANYTQEGVVETTGGDLSIDSSVPATLMSIAAKTDFAATKLVATGFNLLRRAMAVGDGWYFMVPALSFGTINTASQPNGVLFTNSQGENLRPTVYFKPLASGVPTSVTDGTACAYTDASTGGKDYRFFTTSQAGYIIVSGIDRAATCAHIGWSKRYDEYIAIDNVNDAGSEVDIAAGIHALHSYDKMLTVGNVADRIEKSGDNQVTWHRLVDHVQPTWTNTPVESEGAPTGDYIHTATISGMKVGGAAAFETLGITLLVDGTTISFTDQNATVENDYVKYELATEATGTAAVSSSFTVEDWGLIIIQGTVGSAYINIAYAQGIPDSVRQMLSNIDNKTIPVIAEAMLYLYNENKALQELLAGKDNAVLPVVKAQSVECDDILTMGVPNALYSSVAGAPSAANVPDNWDEETMTVWNGCPRKIGQQYVDKVNKKVYYAVAVTGSTNDWVVLN